MFTSDGSSPSHASKSASSFATNASQSESTSPTHESGRLGASVPHVSSSSAVHAAASSSSLGSGGSEESDPPTDSDDCPSAQWHVLELARSQHAPAGLRQTTPSILQ